MYNTLPLNKPTLLSVPKFNQVYPKKEIRTHLSNQKVTIDRHFLTDNYFLTLAMSAAFKFRLDMTYNCTQVLNNMCNNSMPFFYKIRMCNKNT